jgi:hypothetical protein
MTRRGNRNPLLWNYAADYAINPILNEEVVPGQFEWPKQPDGSRMGLYEEKYVGMRAEDIYDLLKEDQEQQKKATEDSGESEESGTHVIDSDENLSEPDSENSVVQDVRDDQAEEEKEMGEGGEEKPGGKPVDKPGEEGKGKGEGEPGGDKPGEGDGEQSIVGKRVRITVGPNAGKIGTVKNVLPNGDIIVE